MGYSLFIKNFLEIGFENNLAKCLNGYISYALSCCLAVSDLFLMVFGFILLHEKFLQFDWLKAVVFQLNLKYLYVKITKPLRVVV